ncbi:MAG TPA: Xaa-Pro peptidase family protein [Methylomirabilota bacterium]|nr:Xaa-Pro peptidase family protein [Methylomirabilota bacterium]
MKSDVIARQREVMSKNGLDALVAASPENFAYTTGFVVPSQPILRWRHNMAAVTAAGRTALLAVDMEESTVRKLAPGQDVRVWGEFTDRPMRVLAALLTDLGLASARVGIEFDYLPAGDFAELRSLLPRAELVPAEQLYHRLRQIKTPGEIEYLRRLSRIADQAIGDCFRAVRAGMTEMDMAGALTRSIYAQGAEHFKLMIIATGERSVLPNVGPTNRVLRPGDICRVEIFSVIGGYHAGVCRTAMVQRAPANAERIWAKLVESKYEILDMLRPGASSRAVYQAFLRRLDELGMNLPPISFVGHGIGQFVHEEPYLGKYSDTPLEAGMVLGIEPLTYGGHLGFGLQLKDMVAITSTGTELLSDRTNTDKLFVIP